MKPQRETRKAVLAPLPPVPDPIADPVTRDAVLGDLGSALHYLRMHPSVPVPADGFRLNCPGIDGAHVGRTARMLRAVPSRAEGFHQAQRSFGTGTVTYVMFAQDAGEVPCPPAA